MPPCFAAELFRHYHDPASVEPDAAFALLDTVLNLPMNRVSPADQTLLVEFATLVARSTVRPPRRQRRCG